MSDVRIYHTTDNGDIELGVSDVVTDEGITSAVYLSLFGGNEDDTGASGDRAQWWGNLLENEPARTYRAETQYTLQTLLPTSGNLRRVEDAIKRDLDPLIDAGVFTDVDVTADIIETGRLQINITATAQGREELITFSVSWRAAANRNKAP